MRGSPLELIDLSGYDLVEETEPDTFLANAPCAITEGPFVRRHHTGTSYFDDLRLISAMPSVSARRAVLYGSFLVLDFSQRLRDEDVAVGLKRLIAEAKTFRVAAFGDRQPGRS